MKVIEALRYCHADWVVFVDLDKTGSEAFSKKMKVKNITWDRLRHIEWKNVSSICYWNDGCLCIRYKNNKAVYEQ